MTEPLQLHRAQVLRQKSRAVLDAVTDAVGRAVEAYRERYFAICEKQVHFSANPSGGFSLERRRYPAIAVECHLEPSADTIAASYRATGDATSPVVERRAEIRLVVGANDAITMETANRTFAAPDDAARFLVEEILD